MSVAYQEITRETSRAHTSRRHPKLRVVGEQSAAVHSKSRGEEVCHGDARGAASVTALRVAGARRRWNTPALGAVRRPVAFAPEVGTHKVARAVPLSAPSVSRSRTVSASLASNTASATLVKPVRGAAVPGVRSSTASLDSVVRMGVRVALTIAVTLLLASFAMIVGTTFLETGMATVTVQGGDSLASIAASIPGVPDISTGVADIVNLNGLSSHNLVPGQVLEIPGY
ncbi:LysM peptidoglycan-binding domain-containing protein [Actinotignum sanguinis]|uniref:LysM peptidoglycan-binding domain-containing protein n=1 Tax=Actinotignum sanguinis TaxID=1445614 RepID=UPI0013DFEB99|nr:LysM peptidoglycan-binding domain-containing protein [Actinotignum sanguinis]MDY5148559.1 LysM peptidoglycan-binding domain-containing protein [Actinotignum sanguinis]